MRSYEQIEAQYEALIAQKNEIDTRYENGIYERWVNPVLTRAHVPPFWCYDPNPETNPFMMQRLGINAAFNSGALMVDGKYTLVARVEGAAQRRLAVRLLSSALICGLGGMAAVRIGANILATWVYNEPELAGMFILSAPLTLLFAVQHAVNALLSGLGEQRQALMPALAGSLLTLALLHRWTALPGARIAGAIRAMQLGQSATLLSTLGLLALALRQSKTPD